MTELEEILEQLNEFEESVEMFVLVARIVYDARAHASLMQEANQLKLKIQNSNIDEENKIILLSSINNLFEQAYVEIQS